MDSINLHTFRADILGTTEIEKSIEDPIVIALEALLLVGPHIGMTIGLVLIRQEVARHQVSRNFGRLPVPSQFTLSTGHHGITKIRTYK